MLLSSSKNLTRMSILALSLGIGSSALWDCRTDQHVFPLDSNKFLVHFTSYRDSNYDGNQPWIRICLPNDDGTWSNVDPLELNCAPKGDTFSPDKTHLGADIRIVGGGGCSGGEHGGLDGASINYKDQSINLQYGGDASALPNDNAGEFGQSSAPDQVNPATDELPSIEVQRKVENHTVFDRTGKAVPFQSIYNGPDVARRVLVIFVRHFFCGSCQEFLRALSKAVTPESLSHLSVSTSIVIIGCGDPGLIDSYATETGCPFPMFSDPTRKLFDDLELVTSLALGPRPEYIRKNMVQIVVESMMQGMKHVFSGLATKGGDPRQIGGEFLFEVKGDGATKEVTWCHRMTTTRDHTEISELLRIIDLDRQGQDKA
ncbi:uncharacterized protein N7511_010028 [Penicillium nucicola]|uniref:uncharacterized protein n=1 Tax=Penicillium nucicola TaxID=1850975 RepID=UPI00254590A0|nr:uncharacterized protein N7511_010028 [Penicillium nucicola]KAJ5748332.1 hypothetical protein N7511_010028 [Penicillium nucicola]